jgi:hypothetical protein
MRSWTSGFLTGFTAQYQLRGTVWRGQSSAPVPFLALEALDVELGLPLLLFLPFAAGYALARGGMMAKAVQLAPSVVLPLVLYHALQALFFARFLLPCTPFLALIAACGIVAFREANPVSWARRPLALGAAVMLLVGSPLARSLYLHLILHRPDTRLLAKTYLDRVASPGSVIVRGWKSAYMPPLSPGRYRLLALSLDPSLLYRSGASADFYLFNSFDTGRMGGNVELEEQALVAALGRLSFVRVAFTPLRDDGAVPYAHDQVYLPYRNLFRYERPGPSIVIYARPGTLIPPHLAFSLLVPFQLLTPKGRGQVKRQLLAGYLSAISRNKLERH